MAKKRVLIVDDVEFNRIILKEILHAEYDVIQAHDGFTALECIFSQISPPDIVLLDIMMPGMDGYEVLDMVRSNPATRNLPVIFITAADAHVHESKSLVAGAADYLSKPYQSDIVLARVRNQIELLSYREEMEHLVEEKVKALADTQEDMLKALASLIEYRNLDYGEHINNTSYFARQLIYGLLEDSPYAQELISSGYEWMIKAVAIHDIGMISVPDSVLLKPSRLQFGEYELVKSHTVVGSQIIETMRNARSDPFLMHCRDICRFHHERWDGLGYPDGLCGEAIPLSARILAVVDVYDALISARIYKPPMSEQEALAQIVAGTESQFDPEIVTVFRRIHPKLQLADAVRDS